MPGSLRSACILLAFIAFGCSHTYFQFHVDVAQQREIMAARNALAVSTRDPAMLARVVDLNGRRAVETLIAGVTVEQTRAEPQFQRLVRALYLGVMGDAENPLAALDSDLTWIAARVGQRVAVTGLQQMGLGGLAAMVGAVAPDDSAQRLREMQGSLARGQIGACTELRPIISYDAAILGHIDSQLAERDPIYRDWRNRVRAIHLVSFGCPHGRVLVVFTKNANEAGVRAIGWHVISHAEWQALEPRLRHALDLS